MKLILYNDDFGVTYGLTNAIRDSFLNGTTTCASIRTNGLAYPYAVEEVIPTVSGLELGLHLNLTEGPPNADPSQVPRLIDRRGYMKNTFLDFYRSLKHDAELLKETEIEMRAQFENAVQSGLALNHVNGHQHIHMIPEVFEIICRMMNQYGIRFIRIPSEPFFFSSCFQDTRHMICNFNLIKHLLLRRLSWRAQDCLRKSQLKSVGCFVGILYTGRMSLEAFETGLRKLEGRGIPIAEILFHPAYIDDQRDASARGGRVPEYYYLPERKMEKEYLLSEKMKRILRNHAIETINHSHLESTGDPLDPTQAAPRPWVRLSRHELTQPPVA